MGCQKSKAEAAQEGQPVAEQQTGESKSSGKSSGSKSETKPAITSSYTIASLADSNTSNNKGSAAEWSEDDYEILPVLQTLMDVAIEKEPEVTALLKGIEAEFQGKLDGLDFKFKTKESILRKVRKMVDRKRVDALNDGTEQDAVDIIGTVWSTTDALRYTVLLSTERYTTAVKAAMERFEDHGMQANELKNFWPGGDNYQGINDVFRLPTDKSPCGYMLFEIQFHTPESFDSKMQSHHFYESFRSTHDPMEKLKSWKELCEAAHRVPVPEGVMDIPEQRSNPNPGELELYCELVLMRNRKTEPALKALVEENCVGALSVESNILSTKELQSMMRSMVDESDNLALQEATNRCYEALNISVVFPEDSYTALAQKATWALQHHVLVQGCRNGWKPPTEQFTLTHHTARAKDALQAATRGDLAALARSNEPKDGRLSAKLGWAMMVTVPSEDDGVAFTDDAHLPCTVSMHTESSLQAQVEMMYKWSEYRKARTQADRMRLAQEIRSLHESVKVPAAAGELQQSTVMVV